jgi:hypothetical protein
MIFQSGLPKVVLACIFLFGLTMLKAQNTQKLSLDDSPVEGQFRYVYSKSSDYEEYKMVKRWHFSRLKNHVLDTLNTLKNDLYTQNLVLEKRDSTIDSLVKETANIQAHLDQSQKEKDTLKWLGFSMSKTTYNGIVWTLTIFLLASLIIVFLLFKRANSLTVSTRQDLSDLSLEFEDFRKRALRREEEIVRKYHNELNKYRSKAGKLSQQGKSTV